VSKPVSLSDTLATIRARFVRAVQLMEVRDDEAENGSRLELPNHPSAGDTVFCTQTS